MKREFYMSWDTYFSAIAVLSSYRSKDPKQQAGACIVGHNDKIIGIGYNGLPRGCDDDDAAFEFWRDEDDSDTYNSKHTYVVHAEQNAIYNCMVHDMTQARIYTTLFPCHICAQAIVQVGIKKVIYQRIKPHHKATNDAVRLMFDRAAVECICYYDRHPADADFIADLEVISKRYAPR